MLWVGVGIGIAVGGLLILAFWLGQRSANLAKWESREKPSPPQLPLGTTDGARVPDMEMPHKTPEATYEPRKIASDEGPREHLVGTKISGEGFAHELPELVDILGWEKLFGQVAEGAKYIEPPSWPEFTRGVLRYDGQDRSFCGAITSISDSFHWGRPGRVSVDGSPMQRWRAQLVAAAVTNREPLDSPQDEENSWQYSDYEGMDHGFLHGISDWEIDDYRETWRISSGGRAHNKWDIYVGSPEPSTVNVSRGGLDRLGRGSGGDHTGTWRDDL